MLSDYSGQRVPRVRARHCAHRNHRGYPFSWPHSSRPGACSFCQNRKSESAVCQALSSAGGCGFSYSWSCQGRTERLELPRVAWCKRWQYSPFLMQEEWWGWSRKIDLCSCMTHASPLPSWPPTAIERLMGCTIPPLLRTPGLFAVSQLRLWSGMYYPSITAGETKEIQNRVCKSHRKNASLSLSLRQKSVYSCYIVLFFILLGMYYLQWCSI